MNSYVLEHDRRAELRVRDALRWLKGLALEDGGVIANRLRVLLPRHAAQRHLAVAYLHVVELVGHVLGELGDGRVLPTFGLGWISPDL